MLKVVLVDNERPLLDELEYLLQKHENIAISGMFTDSVEALKKIETIRPDAVFLDIDMPILNGLNLAREIMTIDKTISIIFITAFDNYAVQAFELNAIDYIMKPIRNDRLADVIDKLNTMYERELFKRYPMSDKIDSLEDDHGLNFRKIAVFDGEEYNLIPAEEILYISVQNKYTDIFTKETIYNSKKSLDYWENRLKKQGFFRCHRNYTVNLKYIIRISPMFNNNFVIKIAGQDIDIPLSKNHMVELKRILKL